MKRVKVRGHRTRVEGGDWKSAAFTVWGWRCQVCNDAGGAWSWRNAYDEGDEHARSCTSLPLQLIYAIRLPAWNWYTDPVVARGIPGTSREVETADSTMAVRYMNFPADTSVDRQAAAVIKDGKNGVRVLDMTPNAAISYRLNWLQAENA